MTFTQNSLRHLAGAGASGAAFQKISTVAQLPIRKRRARSIQMRVLIQNCLTNKFLSPRKAWVADVEKAEDFQKTLRAWAEIDEQKLSGVRIVLNIGPGVPDVALANIGTDQACSKSDGAEIRAQNASTTNEA